jgi:NAD(P)-dependent dehydrogenase (short-subunit alcohol dehydrogenase family)
LILVVIFLLAALFTKKGCSESYTPNPFQGKTILVTGGTSGIGLATAKAFAAAGAQRVVVCGRTPSKWEKARQTISSNVIEYYQCDVRVEEQVKKMIDWIGVLHVAFNNAGVASGAPITQQSIPNNEKDGVISYTVPKDNCPVGMTDPDSKFCENPIYTDGMGIMYCMKYEIASMRKNGIEGSIVNTASANSIWGSPGGAIYSMAKGMVKLLTQSAGSYEVSQPGKKQIRVNCVAPGPVNTPLITSQFPAGTAQSEIEHLASAGVPMGRLAEPSEIANVVVFLANNDLASYVTGAMFVVDGGLTAAPILNPAPAKSSSTTFKFL